MKKTIALVVVALALPTSVAFAKSPHQTHGKSNPQVAYVLKGTLSSYTAATSTADGSIMIHVTHSNFHGRLLKGSDLKFAVAQSTRVTMLSGTTQISDNSKGVLKFRGPLLRKAQNSVNLATALTTSAKALHIIDQSR